MFLFILFFILIEITISVVYFFYFINNSCKKKMFGPDIYNIIFITLCKIGNINLIMLEFTNTLPIDI